MLLGRYQFYLATWMVAVLASYSPPVAAITAASFDFGHDRTFQQTLPAVTNISTPAPAPLAPSTASSIIPIAVGVVFSIILAFGLAYGYQWYRSASTYLAVELGLPHEDQSSPGTTPALHAAARPAGAVPVAAAESHSTYESAPSPDWFMSDDGRIEFAPIEISPPRT